MQSVEQEHAPRSITISTADPSGGEEAGRAEGNLEGMNA
jgi:hypothetical protein